MSLLDRVSVAPPFVRSDKPRVLYIGADTPWCGGAGHLVRQTMFIEALSRVADLQLALFNHNPKEITSPHGHPITSLPALIPTHPSKFELLAHDLTSPLPRAFYWFKGAARSAIHALDPNSFDAIVAFRVDFAHYAGVLNHPRLLLDVDDPEHLRQLRALTTDGRQIDWRTARDLNKLARFERDAVARAAVAFVCQSNDARAFPTGRIEVIPNCVHVPDFPQPRRDDAPPNLLFVGNCAGGSSAPNGNGLQWFLVHVWPLIQSSLPDTRLHLVGHGCAALIPPDARNVESHGFVDDLADLYASASCTIAPIRFGTGTRIKILESFAHACPVVSTFMGCDGLGVTADQDLLLGDSPEAFARHCLTLLTDPVTRHRLGFAGYCLADRLYNRRRQQADLAHRLLQHIELVRSAN